MMGLVEKIGQMAAPFQGIDDGLAGKIWPTLSRKGPGASTQANGWMMPKKRQTLASSPEDPSTKVVGLDLLRSLMSTSLTFSNPTCTLDSVVWVSDNL
jgi:hypothetical protein